MKKITIALAVAMSGFTTTIAQAVPQDKTWYTGAKLGWSQYHDTGASYDNVAIGNGPTHPHQLGTGAFLGYQANPYVGLEMGYDWLGRMPYKGSINNGAFKAQGIQLAAKLSYPIVQDFDIYTRLGGMVWRADANASFVNAAGGRQNVSNHDTGVSPLAAIGFEYAMTENLAARLDYQWVNNIGDAYTVGARPDNGTLSLGVSYRFGQSAGAPVRAQPDVITPAVAPIVAERPFSLKSEVLFNFNESKLKPEGEQELNTLHSQLSSIDPKKHAITVVGFTDAIGNEQYNQKLSQQRADTIVDYLEAKGIPADQISGEGRGPSDPVTGNACKTVEPREAKIRCMAPDRRVDIVVKGVKDIVTQSPN